MEKKEEIMKYGMKKKEEVRNSNKNQRGAYDNGVPTEDSA